MYNENFKNILFLRNIFFIIYKININNKIKRIKNKNKFFTLIIYLLINLLIYLLKF